MIENKLLTRPKSSKSVRRRAVLRWQVFCGQQWCGDVVIFEAPTNADLSKHDFLYDGITPGGDTVGPFESRGAAAMAIGAKAVSR